MDASEKMKYKLANGMKELLVHTPVDKITVKQIVDQCDVTRPTFYRHFKDKYDLINWYFDVLAQMSFKQMGISLTLREGLIKKFEFIKGEGQFFAMTVEWATTGMKMSPEQLADQLIEAMPPKLYDLFKDI